MGKTVKVKLWLVKGASVNYINQGKGISDYFCGMDNVCIFLSLFRHDYRVVLFLSDPLQSQNGPFWWWSSVKLSCPTWNHQDLPISHMGTRKTLFDLPVICIAGKWSSLQHCSQSPESATMTEYWLPRGLRAGISKLRKASSFSFWKVSQDSTPYTVTYLGSILLTNRDSSFAISGICGHVNIGSRSFLLSFSVSILHLLLLPSQDMSDAPYA